jgi:hypothetical protein
MKTESSKFKVLSSKNIFLCLLVFGLYSFASFTLINSYNTKANTIAIDNFSCFYSATGNGITKFNADGKFISRYEEFKYGNLGMVDVSNPLKLLAFYPDFLTVVTLDKFLAPLTTYNFFELGYQNISAVASSTDGRLWFYDNTDFKLKKIDETGKIFLESQPLNVLLEQTPNPNFMIERDNRVYMNDSSIGILVFDVFGSYSKTIPLRGLKRFQVLQDQIVYFDSKQLNSYNSSTFELKTLSLPDTTDVQLAVLEKDRLGILKQNRVDFYRY